MDFLDWDNLQLLEPPITKDIKTEDLERFKLDWDPEKNGKPLIPDVPNHTQAVERFIKLVTEVSSRFHSHDTRHWEILLYNEFQRRERARKLKRKLDST